MMAARVTLGDPARDALIVPHQLHASLKTGRSITQLVDVVCDDGRGAIGVSYDIINQSLATQVHHASLGLEKGASVWLKVMMPGVLRVTTEEPTGCNESHPPAAVDLPSAGDDEGKDVSVPDTATKTQKADDGPVPPLPALQPSSPPPPAGHTTMAPHCLSTSSLPLVIAGTATRRG